MPLIHQHQIVLLEAIDGDGLDLAFLLQLVHIDYDHIILLLAETAILLEHRRRDGRQGKLIQVLFTHTLVGRQHDNLVNGQPAVDSLGPLEIMQKLQNVHVHDQRFAAAGGAHKSQLVQFIRRIGLKINEPEGSVFDLPQPFIEISAKCVRVGKIPIQIHFREEQGNILEILPLQSASLLSNLAGVTADIFIIQA